MSDFGAYRRGKVIGFFFANIFMYFICYNYNNLQVLEWGKLFESLKGIVSVGGLTFLVQVINQQLPPHVKTQLLCFGWKHPQPGSRAFSKYAYEDDRIDVNSLQERYGPFPDGPKEQNTKWYKLYKTVEETPSVKSVHMEYIAIRDCYVFAILILIVFIPVGIIYIENSHIKLLYIVYLFVQTAVLLNAARNRGIQFVKTVLAVKSSNEGKEVKDG